MHRKAEAGLQLHSEKKIPPSLVWRFDGTVSWLQVGFESMEIYRQPSEIPVEFDEES